MTLVFAAGCRDGVVVAGDTRVTAGDDMLTHDVQHKVRDINGDTVVGFAGNRFLGQRFLEKMQWAADEKGELLLDPVREAEDILKDIWGEYVKAGNGNRDHHDDSPDDRDSEENKEDCDLETLVVGRAQSGNDRVRIYYIRTRLVPDVSDDFACVGEPGRTAEGAKVVLWDAKITVGEAWPLAAVIMKVTDSRHSSVGGIPDVYLMRDNGKLTKVPLEEVESIYSHPRIEGILKGIPQHVLSQLQSENHEK